jgi:hypothetical protein
VSLDVLWKLDPVSPASNSNYAGADIGENCAPSGLNNALRALGSFVAQQLCYQGSNISASVSTNIATTTTGVYNGIVGTGNITSFGTVPGEQPGAAVIRILLYGNSVSVSHSSGKITLLGNASRRMEVGDIQGLIHEGSGDHWREFLFFRRDGSQLAASISATTLTAGSISASAVSTVTLSAASASVTAIGFTSLQATSISASVGDFTILRASGARVMGPLLHIRDEKTSGTDGGTSTGDAWTKHTLDDVKTNEISGASVATSVISLQPGPYYAEGWFISRDDDGAQARLRQVSSISATLVVGSSGISGQVDGSSSLNTLSGRFSLSNSASIEFQYWVNNGVATTGLGSAVTSGEVEIYADLRIWKL